MTTAATLGDGVGSVEASVVGAVLGGAAAVEADGDAPGPQAARKAALAESVLAHMKPRRLRGVCAILRTI